MTQADKTMQPAHCIRIENQLYSDFTSPDNL